MCDFDADGQPDLLVGAENGRIYHIKHGDCSKYPEDALRARTPEEVPPPRFPGLVTEGVRVHESQIPPMPCVDDL